MTQQKSRSPSTLEERCVALAAAKLDGASRLPPGPERDALEREARQLKTVSQMQDWLSSPGLQPPK